jgi:hypothetical protein
MTPEIVRKGHFQGGFPVLRSSRYEIIGTRHSPALRVKLSGLFFLRSFRPCEVCRAQPLEISNQ